MNKAKSQSWKWAAGIVVTLLLLWHLYRQIQAQLHSGVTFNLWPQDTALFFCAALALLPVNICFEAAKWQRLVATAVPLSFAQALRSVLSGIAASIVTPNRIGEYPARIMLLKEPNSTRLVSVSVLGACAQLLALMIAGVLGLCYYCWLHPEPVFFIVFTVTVLFSAALMVLYFAFERWAPKIENIRWLRKLHLWGRLLYRFSGREQAVILLLSLLRFLTYTTQFWLMLRWQGIELPLAEGLLLCALFFWAMAVIPSITLAELGIRGAVSLFLFQPYSPNAAGITAATFVLWLMNLLLPALVGVFFFFRKAR